MDPRERNYGVALRYRVSNSCQNNDSGQRFKSPIETNDSGRYQLAGQVDANQNHVHVNRSRVSIKVRSFVFPRSVDLV